MRAFPGFMTLALLVLTSASLSAQKAGISLDNQASTWFGMNFPDGVTWQAGARYIPSLSPWVKAGSGGKIDAEVSVNAYGTLWFTGKEYDSTTSYIKPYRLWIRYSNSRFEIRAGLQKINFGSSNILRPLMWFDKMDFRDPLMLTDGVYALLGRYYFANNANMWLWTLYGNDKPKGWETVPSLKNIPEYGGRMQLPVPRGELALSYHHRDADYSALLATVPGVTETRYTEQLFAADGKWDLGPGLWFEVVQKLNEKGNPLTTRWESWYSLGIDYTFGLGNGINVSSEFFRYTTQTDNDQLKRKSNYSTLSISYPLHLSHNISALVYYNWDNKEWYRFLNLQLKYDYFSFYIMTFWNPDELLFFSSNESSSSYSGTGFQIMFVLDI